MGRTPKPLRIAVTDADLLEHPKLKALVEQGHDVRLLVVVNPAPAFEAHSMAGEMPDLVLGRRAWYSDEEHITRYLELALKAARKRAYPKEPEEVA